MLSVAFSARTLGLVLIFDKRKRVVVKTQRVRGSPPEEGAKRLVREFGARLAASVR